MLPTVITTLNWQVGKVDAKEPLDWTKEVGRFRSSAINLAEVFKWENEKDRGVNPTQDAIIGRFDTLLCRKFPNLREVTLLIECHIVEEVEETETNH